MANFTKQAIKISFMKLLNEKPFNKITVRDIVEACGINRNSFYYHFRDIPALMEEIIVEETNALIEQYPTMDSLDEFIDAFYAVCMENKKALLHIFNSVNRDLYEQHLMRLCREVVSRYMKQAFSEIGMDDEEKRLGIETYKCMLFGFCIDWMTNGLKEEYIQDLHAICNTLNKFYHMKK